MFTKEHKCFTRFSHPVGDLALLFLLVLEPKVRIRLAKREGVVAKGGGVWSKLYVLKLQRGLGGKRRGRWPRQ